MWSDARAFHYPTGSQTPGRYPTVRFADSGGRGMCHSQIHVSSSSNGGRGGAVKLGAGARP